MNIEKKQKKTTRLLTIGTVWMLTVFCAVKETFSLKIFWFFFFGSYDSVKIRVKCSLLANKI